MLDNFKLSYKERKGKYKDRKGMMSPILIGIMYIRLNTRG